jgi:hypothetical protein
MSANFSWVWQTVLGGIISLSLAGLFRWITKPRLRFQIASSIPFVLVGPRHDSPTGLATWIRVRVHNRGLRNAESCRVYLTDIFREGQEEPILKEDAMPLWASTGGDRDEYAPLSISRKFGRFFDIGFIPPDRQLVVASDEFSIRRRQQPLPPARFWSSLASSYGDTLRRVTSRAPQLRMMMANEQSC